MTLLDMGGLLPQEEWVTTAKISHNGDALVVIPISPERLTGFGAASQSLFSI
jgi:hypothetical protein